MSGTSSPARTGARPAASPLPTSRPITRCCLTRRTISSASMSATRAGRRNTATAPAAAPDPIRKENAESLLRKVIELNDPKQAAVAYILAVMLERKRLLKVKEQFLRDGQRVFVYEQPRSGDLFTIPDPNLQLSQLDQVQRDVAALLEQGLDPAASPGAEPAAATAVEAAPPSLASEAALPVATE